MSITPLAQARIIKHSLDYSYYLYDRFSTALAAGSINGTQAEPVGGVRFVTDTLSKLSIGNGICTLASTGSAAGNPGIWYPAQSRALGKVLLCSVTPSTNSVRVGIGWDGAQTGTPLNQISFGATTSLFCGTGATIPAVGVYEASIYQTASVLRAAGEFHFIKGGAFTNWTLLYTFLTDTTASLYPTFSANNNQSVSTTFDNIRVPKQTYIPVPLQSDGMSAATVDGLGNPENNGIAGNTYTNVGTWGVSAGVRSCSVLGGGGTGNGVLATSTRNVVIEVNITRSSGSAGIRARQADTSNYIQCVHDGTNVVVSQVIAGTPTTLSTTAVAYSAGATMKFIADGLTYRAVYNNTAAGSGVLPDTTSTNHGIITNHIGATFDNLVIWPRGNEGQHEELDLL